MIEKIGVNSRNIVSNIVTDYARNSGNVYNQNATAGDKTVRIQLRMLSTKIIARYLMEILKVFLGCAFRYRSKQIF